MSSLKVPFCLHERAFQLACSPFPALRLGCTKPDPGHPDRCSADISKLKASTKHILCHHCWQNIARITKRTHVCHRDFVKGVSEQMHTTQSRKKEKRPVPELSLPGPEGDSVQKLPTDPRVASHGQDWPCVAVRVSMWLFSL